MTRFYLSRRERRRLTYVVFLLILIFAVRFTWENVPRGDKEIWKKQTSEKRHRGETFSVEEREAESFTFDPNEADSTQLLRLGLNPAQVRSIYRHRAKGYRYSNVEDFMYTPFLTNEQWEHLKPLIRIADKYKLVERPQRKGETYQHELDTTDKPQWEKVEKVKSGTMVNINTADSATLRSVPGIGEFWAGKILRLRSRYGGFATIRQLAEEKNFPEQALAYLSVTDDGSAETTIVARRININKASFQKMVNHPYLSFKQVEAVKDFNRKYGEIHSMKALLALPVFTPEDTLRLKPYIEF